MYDDGGMTNRNGSSSDIRGVVGNDGGTHDIRGTCAAGGVDDTTWKGLHNAEGSPTADNLPKSPLISSETPRAAANGPCDSVTTSGECLWCAGIA